MTILNIIKQDPTKEILISNILHSDENPDSEFYLISYEEKIAEIAANTLSDCVRDQYKQYNRFIKFTL